MNKSPPPILQFISVCLGNFFEHYEGALFGFLSPFLAPMIFPNQDPLTALILTYAMIPLGMLARPLGALFFGLIGDTYGRKTALFWSLLAMAALSFGIALCPTYETAGFITPLIFMLGRILQNFLASGENMGGAIFLLESAPKKHHDLLSGIYNASTMGGILVASLGVSLFYPKSNADISWRFLYLAGSASAIFGCFLRSKAKNMIFPSTKSGLTKSLSNMPKVLWKERRALLIVSLLAGFGYANYTFSLVILNGFLPLISNVTQEEMSRLNSFLLIFDFLTLPLFGYLSSLVSREKMMLTASLCVAFLAIPAFMLLEDASLGLIAFIRIGFVLFGVAFFAPFHAFVNQLVGENTRYLILSFGYALGSQLIGGPVAPLSLWLFKQTTLTSSIAWVWVFFALITGFIIIKKMKSETVLSEKLT